jgi:hypothetical protein
MPRKKKDPNEMTDRELLRSVFPEVVVRRIEEELGALNAEKSGDSDSAPPDGAHSKE